MAAPAPIAAQAVAGGGTVPASSATVSVPTSAAATGAAALGTASSSLVSLLQSLIAAVQQLSAVIAGGAGVAATMGGGAPLAPSSIAQAFVTPAQTSPGQTSPAQSVPAQTSPAQSVPAQTVPAQTPPSKPIPAQAPPTAPTKVGGVGVPAGTSLRTVGPNQLVPGTNLRTDARGDLTITTPGAVIDGIDLHGQIKVQAANVTIRNSRIRGPIDGGSHNTALIDANAASVKNLVITNNTLVPDHPSYWLDGVIGHDYTARGNDVSHTVDGFGVYNNTGNKRDANVVIEGNYIHDLSWFAHDEDHTDGTHNDGIQIQGGANITIRGNRIDAYDATNVGTTGDAGFDRRRAQGIIVSKVVSTISNVLIDGNTIEGGKVGITTTSRSAGDIQGLTISNNRLGRDQFNYGNDSRYQLRFNSQSIANQVAGLATNVWADTGGQLTQGRNTGIRVDG